MRRNRLATICAALLVALLALPALAHASGDDVIRDCYDDGHIDGSYSQRDYQQAADNLPSDIDQYSDCRDVIAQARADGSRGNGNGGGGGANGSDQSRRGGSPKPYEGNPALQTPSGAYAPSQDDKNAYDRARNDAARGEAALPGGLAIPAAGDFTPVRPNSIPMPVLLALVSVGLLVIGTSLLVARRRFPALSRVARRVVRR